MISQLPIHVWEMIEMKVNQLKYDDVMQEMKSIDIEKQIKSLDYEYILFNDNSRRKTIQSRENNMLSALEYEFETDTPEIKLCMDIILIKRIHDNRQIIYEEIGLNSDDIIIDIIKDAIESNGLMYNESEKNMMKLMNL